MPTAPGLAGGRAESHSRPTSSLQGAGVLQDCRPRAAEAVLQPGMEATLAHYYGHNFKAKRRKAIFWLQGWKTLT